MTETAWHADPAYAALVTGQAAIVTPESALKWGPLRPEPGRFDFVAADRLVDTAAASGLQVRGHNLVWHENLPSWLERAARQGDLAAILSQHIDTVCRRYAGRLAVWDVVNEPIRPEDGAPMGLRDTLFLQRIGPRYIEQALHAARAADPHAILAINEMDLELDDPAFEARRQSLLALLRHLRARGVPLQALGIESHLKWGQAPFDAARFAGFLREVASLGLAIHITELDVADTRLPADQRLRDEAVADLHRRYLDAVLTEPAVRIVSVWELTDRESWLSTSTWTRRADGRRARGCLYDDALAAKPARQAVAEALAARA